MKSKTYTVYDHGDVICTGLTAVEAAREMLARADRAWELRKDKWGWSLYVSEFSYYSPGGRGKMFETEIFSPAESEKEAWEEIAPQILKREWYGYMAFPDEQNQQVEEDNN
jgi:hypothetical protein